MEIRNDVKKKSEVKLISRRRVVHIIRMHITKTRVLQIYKP